ncbi:rhodanese-like domain-containing protein [Candidatus Bathyarchaeota archaeon]|nr:rhodanese-like domain-containing protein [Candidatus Bathyarchaeota archaeon]
MSEVSQKTYCDINELRSVLDGGSSCSLIDVREYPEYAAGRIPQARLIPLGEIEQRAGEIDRFRPVYLVCRTGRRSEEARQRLKALGFTEVYNVKGGFLAWEAAGFPVERDRHVPWSLERQVRFVVGILVSMSVLLSVFVAQPFVWIAGFIGAGLIFAAITDSCLMGMMLARLPWNRPKSTQGCLIEQERIN